MTRSFWEGRRVLVTGHTGFKGAWLALWLQSLGARVTGVALDPEGEGGAFEALRPWDGLDDRRLDICDAGSLEEVVREVDPEVVFHLAAQALVRRGHAEPLRTYHVNVVGTASLLHALRGCPACAAVVVVTSDKVYRNDGSGRPLTEEDPLGGADPYSASKACAELVVRAWSAHASRPAVATARAGNVVGGGDVAPDRLVPDVMRALAAGRPVKVRNPAATRPWQHVLDPLSGYLALAERLAVDPTSVPPAMNFGPSDRNPPTVAEVVEAVLGAWGAGSWEESDGAGPEEAPRLALDPSSAATVLGWRARLGFEDAVVATVEWQRAQLAGKPVRELALDQIARYEART